MIRLFIFLAICLSSVLQAQTINQKIEEMMQKHVELDQFSGTVLLAKEGKILYAEAFGDASHKLLHSFISTLERFKKKLHKDLSN